VPSQKQVRWAQLRVGITVIFATLTLCVLIFLMSGTTGIFTKKLTLLLYQDNAGGLRIGAPVRLEGVDIGNVTGIGVVAGAEHAADPVQIKFKISSKFQPLVKKDSTATLATAGVLGETFIDIDSRKAVQGAVQDGDQLKSLDTPSFGDVVKSTQGTLENVDILLKRTDRIIAQIESGQGSIGKLIYDQDLYNRLNSTLAQVQNMVGQISSGKGSIGKLINDDELYNKANKAVDNLNNVIDQVNKGEGTVGKLIKDPSLYNNLNETIQKTNALLADVNAGKGALGKFAHDEAFAKKLDDTITHLNNISAKIDNGEGSVGKLMNDPALYNNSDQMLVETRHLLQAVRENPKKYLTFHVKVF
jgi:phospholipid/cholesterol/gamma-HCH transport system substrate-binding protein